MTETETQPPRDLDSAASCREAADGKTGYERQALLALARSYEAADHLPAPTGYGLTDNARRQHYTACMNAALADAQVFATLHLAESTTNAAYVQADAL